MRERERERGETTDRLERFAFFTPFHTIQKLLVAAIQKQNVTKAWQEHTMRAELTSSKAIKAVKTVMPATTPHWVGNGFNVYPVFAQLAFTKALSPWLMFDYAFPQQFDPTKQRLGVGKHPHRGFETVTVAFQGAVEHQDSTGNNDVIGPGDVQWMTAGRGIIHEEYHSTEFAKTGGIFEMCQLWVNLPKKHKMHPPRYQPILDKTVPVVQLKAAKGGGGDDGGDAAGAGECAAVGSVRVIAGELEGVRGPAQTFTPILLWDALLTAAGAVVELDVPAGYNTVVFVRRGAVSVGAAGAEQHVGAQGVALLHLEGAAIRLRAEAPDTQLLILGGEPIDEPIAAQGPFVMCAGPPHLTLPIPRHLSHPPSALGGAYCAVPASTICRNTQAEIQQANHDYRSGKMGR